MCIRIVNPAAFGITPITPVCAFVFRKRERARSESAAVRIVVCVTPRGTLVVIQTTDYTRTHIYLQFVAEKQMCPRLYTARTARRTARRTDFFFFRPYYNYAYGQSVGWFYVFSLVFPFCISCPSAGRAARIKCVPADVARKADGGGYSETPGVGRQMAPPV